MSRDAAARGSPHGMQPSDFERRLFGQRNGSSSSAMSGPARSPNVTPTKMHGDRFIPIRQTADHWSNRYTAISSKEEGEAETFKRPASVTRPPTTGPQQQQTPSQQATNGGSPNSSGGGGSNSNNSQNEETRQDQLVAKALIKNELMQDGIDDMGQIREETVTNNEQVVRPPAARNLFSYAHKTPTKYGQPGTSARVPLSSSPSVFSCPLSEESQRLLKSPRKPQRKVPKNPYKVLDAPDLQDDFYLNLVDWSSQNMLSVGLNTCVYLWSACNSQVIKLCDLSSEQDTVTSVQWTDKGEYLAVGTNRGLTQIWDVHQNAKICEMQSHQSRIGCLAWNGDLICSGSRDRSIMIRDIRAPAGERKLLDHRQEVCGLKWSPDKQYLASGGNDNQLIVWGLRRDQPIHKWTEHNAAVKALAWSPHHHGLLVSGGGTADRCLRFWNTLTGQAMQCIDTGSQVCNVAWSKHSSELVSTHGYSYNQVIIWKYPTLQPVTKLTGHQFRVLYLAMSPDGEAIVTGAGDETLRFWHVFNKSGQSKTSRSKLNLFNSMR